MLCERQEKKLAKQKKDTEQCGKFKSREGWELRRKYRKPIGFEERTCVFAEVWRGGSGGSQPWTKAPALGRVNKY